MMKNNISASRVQEPGSRVAQRSIAFRWLMPLLATLLFAACDEVSINERLTYVEPPEVGRAVLIEDFTGQYCVNCPRATEEIERLVEEYGDSVVIAVAIHSGPFSKHNGTPTPLFTELGDEYFNYWQLSSQPIGVLDRLGGFEYTSWGAGVNYEIGFKAPVAFVTATGYDETTRNAAIEVQTIGIDSVTVQGKLQVWLIEDSIESFQYMPDGSINEHYNHMHVLRTSVNDPWGDEIALSHGQVATKNYNITMEPSWVPEHCSVVTFLYDDHGVRQVAKTRLTKPD